MHLKQVLASAVDRLDSADVGSPRLNAEALLMFVLGVNRAYLYAHPERELTQEEESRYDEVLAQRSTGMPSQYITGHQEFWGLDFIVTPSVLIPRPETEHVVEAALAVLRGQSKGPLRLLDVGAGSGAIAITLALETEAYAAATEISPAAAAIAARNAATLGARVDFVVCDLMSGVASDSIDLIVSNPPYVPLAQRESLQREVRDWEPVAALFGGERGFDIYDRIAADAPRVLRPGGWLILELGFGCQPHVSSLLSNWRTLRIEPDLAGIPRVAVAQVPMR